MCILAMVSTSEKPAVLIHCMWLNRQLNDSIIDAVLSGRS